MSGHLVRHFMDPDGPCKASARRGRRLSLLLAAAALAGLVLASAASAASPYPASTILGGVTFDPATHQRYATGIGGDGSDIWDSMWASDGNVYGVWGDGYGFASPTKKQIGVGKLVGTPNSPPLTGSDTYLGSPSPPSPNCVQLPTLGGKPRGVVALPGAAMYMFHSTQDLCTSNSWLAKSGTNGTSWSDHIAGLQWPDAAGFSPSSILQFGQAQAGGLIPDSGTTPYLYIYARKSTDPVGSGKNYLARVPASPTTAIETISNWTYYAGPNAAGDPNWVMNDSLATPVLTDPDHGETTFVTFDKAIGRYLAYDDHGSDCGGSPCERQLSLFDAPTPWGPWTTFDYEEHFDDGTGCSPNCLGSGEAVGWSLMQKWISSDGLTIWPEYNSVGVWDSLNLIKGTIALASGAPVKTVAVSTGKPVVLDKLSLSNPGNLEFIDRTYRFTSIPAAYIGKEVIRLANNDKSASATSTLVSFTIATTQNVCVAWNRVNPLPAWLASWANTGNSLLDSSTTFNVYMKSFPAGAVSLAGAASPENYIPFIC